MSILVTGGCGFLGTHLCARFRDRGHEVIAYDNLTKHELERSPYLSSSVRDYNRNLLEQKGVRVVVSDIRDQDALMRSAYGADYICHAAAQPAMTISCENPLLDFSTNSTGTVHVLEAARRYQIPAAICSTIHAFGPEKINAELTEGETRYDRNPPVIDEAEPILQGTVTPLHASKVSGEIYQQCFRDTYGLEVACFRLTGIYGPHQFGGEDHGWVANFAIRAVLGLPITIFGSGKQVRDILYATDVADAFECFYASRASGLYNLGGGPSTAISLLECIALIQDILGRKVEVQFKESRFGDLKYFVADFSKFQKQTGWTPRVLPREGITQLIRWVEENANLFSAELAVRE